MTEEKLKIEDESGDRKYFTIIPNYILNHSTATAQALYMQLKRLAGEKGIAYPASRYLKEHLGISQPTLRKEIKYLLDKGWVEFIGFKTIETDGGKQKVKSYKIIDLWDLNNNFYSRGEKIDTPYEQRGERIDTQGVKTRGERIGAKEEPSEEDPSFKKNNTVGGLVSYFFSLKGWDTKKGNKRTFASFTRAAKDLLDLCDDDFQEAKECLDKLNVWATSNSLSWSIETVFKKWYELDLLKPKEKKPHFDGCRIFQRVEGGKWYIVRNGEIKELGRGLNQSEIIWK